MRIVYEGEYAFVSASLLQDTKPTRPTQSTQQPSGNEGSGQQGNEEQQGNEGNSSTGNDYSGNSADELPDWLGGFSEGNGATLTEEDIEKIQGSFNGN